VGDPESAWPAILALRNSRFAWCLGGAWDREEMDDPVGSEPPRDFRRLQLLRGWSPWKDEDRRHELGVLTAVSLCGRAGSELYVHSQYYGTLVRGLVQLPVAHVRREPQRRVSRPHDECRGHSDQSLTDRGGAVFRPALYH
jgi:hypothetical protein